MRRGINLFRQISGPSAVAAAGAMGAGTVSTLILAGAWFGYGLLWVVLFTLPFLVIAVDTSSRIGAINAGEGMLSLIRRRIHPSIAWLLLVLVVPVHIFVAMGQFSIMTSACLSWFGLSPPAAGALPSVINHYLKVEITVSVLLGCAILWLVLFRGYSWMQKVMTTFLLLMLLCFVALAIRGFQDIVAIMTGLIPTFPNDLPVPDSNTVRVSNSTVIAIVGSTIAPGGLLALAYLSSDGRSGQLDLKQDFRKCVINFGLIFGLYSACILIAGGYALHSLPHHAEIETVHQAAQVLNFGLSSGPSSLGPLIFSVGLFIAAMTTMIVSVQVLIYTSLDMLNRPWSFSPDNRLYRRLMIATTLFVSIAAPLWSFPAMLKVLLLMGVNVLVVPIVVAALLYLVNQRSVMGENTATLGRNLMLTGCVALSLALAVAKGPDLLLLLVR